MVLKTPEIAREMLQELQKFVQERWRRVFQRATVTGGAWAHAPPGKTGNNRIWLNFFFPSIPRRR
jgi:hypothetical protein